MSSQLHPGHTATEPYASRLAGQAMIAGIIGGTLIDLFLILAHAAPFPILYQFIASTVVGRVAFTSPSYILVGLAIHFAISIGWALLYAFCANALHARRRWVVAGLVFGLIVMVVMRSIEMITGVAQPITLTSGIVTLIAHVVFFGWPVAWWVARSGRQATMVA